MTGPRLIFSIYKINFQNPEAYRHVLVRTSQPGYPNYSGHLETTAGDIEREKRQTVLDSYIELHSDKQFRSIEQIGEFHNYPSGDIRLYSKNGMFDLPVVYIETQNGFPWIILGVFSSTEGFLQELATDEEFMALGPVGEPKLIQVTLITDNDFGLATIMESDDADSTDISQHEL
jgi:hypothetical protein